MFNVQWSMLNGQWSMLNGQWSILNGQWSILNAQWSMFNGLRLHEARSLLHLQAINPRAGDLARSVVLLALREELHAEAGDVICGGELVLALCADALDVHVERAQTVDAYAVRVAQLVLDNLGKLLQTRHDVRHLQRTRALYAVCQRLGTDGGGVDGAAIELVSANLLSVVLIGYILNNSSHNQFSPFLTPPDLPQGEELSPARGQI